MTFRASLLAAIAWLALPPFAFANPTAVMLKIVDAPPNVEPVGAVLQARPAADRLEELQFETRAPGHMDLDLRSGVAWQLDLEAAGYWSESEVVVPGPGGAGASLLLWPTTTIRGKLELPRGEKMPAELTARFEPAPGSRAEGRMAQSTVTCPVIEGAWICEVPAVASDLRLRATGFVSHYLWAIELEAGKPLDLGTLPLRRGASLVGRVEDSGGADLDPETCRVELSPAMVGEPAGRMKRLALSAKLNERGFFHFQGVAPGQYTVTASRAGSAPAQFPGATVMENAETEMTEPLVLRPPLALEVHVSPPFDVSERPWTVELVKFGKVPGTGEDLEGGTTSPEGAFVKKGLAPGRYLVAVQNAFGDRMATDVFELTPEATRLDLELEIVLVQGTLHFDDEPLAANLLFGGRFESQKAEIPSDEEGAFFGFLPRDGEWKILVESETPSISRYLKVDVEKEEDGIARLELEIPATRLTGTVVDESENPVSRRVMIKAFDPVAKADVTTFSDESGRFSFLGLPEGPSRLWGENPEGNLEEVTVELAEDLEPDVRLVLRGHRVISGRVLGRGGPVPGAMVQAWPYDAGNTALLGGGADMITDVEGRFHLDLNGAAETVRVVVLPPGYALKVLPLARPEELAEEPLDIEVEPIHGGISLTLEEPLNFADPNLSRVHLFLAGQAVGFGILQQWRSIQAVSEPDDTTYTIPALPPGPVTVCSARRPESGRYTLPEPRAGACRDAFVSPGSMLRMSLGSS